MARNQIKGISIEIGGNTAPLDKALGDVNVKTSKLQSELREVEKLLKLDPTNTELLSQKQKILGESIGNTSTKLKALKDAEKQAQQQFKEGKISEEQYRGLQREIIKTEQELGKVENQAKKTNTELSSDKPTTNFKNIGKVVGGVALAIGGAMVGLAVKSADALGEIDDAAQRAGTSAEEFQKYAYAAKLSGMETETLEKAMIKQQKAFADAKEGSKSMSEAYTRLGIDINEVGSSSEAFDLVIARLANMEDETERNALANDIFGKSYAELAPLLNQGAEGIEKLKNEAVELGGVMSNEAVAAGAEFGDQLDKVKTAFGGVITKIGVELLPIINEVLTWVLDHMPEIQTVISTVFDVIGVVVTTAYDIFKTIFLPIIESVFNFIQDNFPTIESTFETVFGTISGVIKDVWAFIDDNLLSIFKSIFDSVSDKFPKIQEIFTNVFGTAEDVVTILWDVFKGLWDFIEPTFPLIGSVIETAFDIVIGIVEGVTKTFETLVGWIKDAVSWINQFNSTEMEEKTTGSSGSFGGVSKSLKPYIDGTHADGLPYVPYNGYLAELHKGERVLTAQENSQYGSSVNHSGTIRVEGVNNKGDLMAVTEIVMNTLRRELRTT